ncbi:hypothetical protein J3Q64DRAFT_1716355 [Phycomyces blakesleeanus]|uniref:PH domain-containing protein n=1 Tax=Phycomyces blakesleeanus TaxID=4837 RepID=A0ABR3BGU2_PHYBL
MSRFKSRSHVIQTSSSTSTVDTAGSFGPPFPGTPILESPQTPTPTTSFQKNTSSYFPLFSTAPAALIAGRKTSLSNEISLTASTSKPETLAVLVDTTSQAVSDNVEGNVEDKLKRSLSVTAAPVTSIPTKHTPLPISSAHKIKQIQQTESKVHKDILPKSDSNPGTPETAVPVPPVRRPTYTNATEKSNGNTSRPAEEFSLNRADVVITRLENWLFIIKAIGAWLEETARINVQSSRSFQQQSLSLLKEDYMGQKEPTNAIATLYTGLKMLTVTVIQEQRDFSEHVFQDHIPAIMKLKKECKEKIRELGENQDLAMDELLKRAEVTVKTMSHLDRCCRGMDRETGDDQRLQQLQDPWVANLYVLRQLKKEVDEENRLRILMVGVQKDVAAFERRVIQSLKTSIQFCYENIPPGLSDDSSEDRTPFKALLDMSTPEVEWEQFMEDHKKDLVNEQFPTKDYRNINFKNKHNPYVLTLMKGKIERKTGVRKQFVEKYFVLSQCGFLHQFSLSDKVAPERFIYIPNSVIVPSIDINQFVNESNISNEMTNDESNQHYTFEIRRPSTTVLQRDKTYQFRVSSRQALLDWCKALVEVAGRSYMAQYLVSNRSSIGLNRDSSSISAEDKPPSETDMTTKSTEVLNPSSSDMEAKAGSNNNNDSTLSFVSEVQSGSTECSSKLDESTTQNTRPLETIESETGSLGKLDKDNSRSSDIKLIDDHGNVSDQALVNVLEEGGTNDVIQEYYASHDSGDEDDDADSISSRSICTARQSLSTIADLPELIDIAREPSQVSDPRRYSGESNLIDDAASSLYFSSTSGPNSPSGSTFSIDSYPEIDIAAYSLPALEAQNRQL